MDLALLAVIAIIFVALVFDFINGFHDAANSIATIVSTGVLKPYQAVIWAAFTPVRLTLTLEAVTGSAVRLVQLRSPGGLRGLRVVVTAPGRAQGHQDRDRSERRREQRKGARQRSGSACRNVARCAAAATWEHCDSSWVGVSVGGRQSNQTSGAPSSRQVPNAPKPTAS